MGIGTDMDQKLGWLGRQVAVAVAYGLVYELLRSMSFAHFVPVSGFKLSVLLLTPRRYWPALLITEMSVLAYTLESCIASFGWAFYLFSIAPPIALLMVIVAACRARLPGLALPNFRLSSLLICTLISTAVLVADSLISASLINDPVGVGRKPLSVLMGDYLLGTYTGILAVTPLVLTAAVEWRKRRSLTAIWMNNKALLQATAFALVAMSVEVFAFSYSDNSTLRFAGQAILLVPAAYFLMRWDWKGAAVVGALSSFGIVALMPAKFDLATLMTQTMMALSLTAFIVLGQQTAKLKQATRAKDNHLKKARLEQHLSELRLQRSSFELSFVNVELARAHRHLLIQLGHTHNRGEVETQKHHLTKTTRRLTELANSLAPPMGAGHPHALTEGPILELLGKLGVDYHVNLRGQLSLLSKSTFALLYRLSCEAVAYLLKEHPTDRIVLSTQTIIEDNVMTIALTVQSAGQIISSPARNRIMQELGTYDLGLEELRIRAQLFNGDVAIDGKQVHVSLQQEFITELD